MNSVAALTRPHTFPWCVLLPPWVAVSSGLMLLDRSPQATMAGATAVDRRQVELREGRRHASRVLMMLGGAESIVGTAADRGPIWPPGMIGSLSHAWRSGDPVAPGQVVAVAAHTEACCALGIDLEYVGSLAPELWSRVLTPREYAQVLAMPTRTRSAQVHAWWCAKEATMKARRQILDPREVEIAQPPGDASFKARRVGPGERTGEEAWVLQGRTVEHDGLVAAVAMLPC